MLSPKEREQKRRAGRKGGYNRPRWAVRKAALKSFPTRYRQMKKFGLFRWGQRAAHYRHHSGAYSKCEICQNKFAQVAERNLNHGHRGLRRETHHWVSKKATLSGFRIPWRKQRD